MSIFNGFSTSNKKRRHFVVELFFNVHFNIENALILVEMFDVVDSTPTFRRRIDVEISTFYSTSNGKIDCAHWVKNIPDFGLQSVAMKISLHESVKIERNQCSKLINKTITRNIVTLFHNYARISQDSGQSLYTQTDAV